MLWLVVVHLVVGLMAAFMLYSVSAERRAPRELAFLIGIVSGQSSLLGIWGGLGSTRWWKRLIGVLVGVGYLSLLLTRGSYDEPESVALLVLAATVALPLLLVRYLMVVVQPDWLPVAWGERIQFSIRDLLILPFVVACLIGFGKWAELQFPSAAHIVFIAALGVVGILPVWFVLATRQPVLWGIGVVTVAGYIGYFFASVEGVTAAITESTAVVLSLLVARSCGYSRFGLAPRRQKGW